MIEKLICQNGKGIVFKAIAVTIGGLIGVFVSDKIEDGLNNKFNPELLTERETVKNAEREVLKAALKAKTTTELDDAIDTDFAEEANGSPK